MALLNVIRSEMKTCDTTYTGNSGEHKYAPIKNVEKSHFRLICFYNMSAGMKSE